VADKKQEKADIRISLGTVVRNSIFSGEKELACFYSRHGEMVMQTKSR
jgi:hypothetical protein